MAGQEHQLTAANRAGSTPALSTANLRDAFERQVRRSPDSVAVVFGESSLTYAELDERSSRLAGRLVECAVRIGTPVGLCAGRSLEMVIGILGIVKAGGAYVPLDPAYPSARLSVMRELAGVSLIVGQPQHANVAGDAAFLDLTADGSPGPAAAASPVPDDLANIVFTSGSTGEPKGVEVLHRGILRLVLGVDYVDLSAEHTILQLSSLSFDASTFEIWGALLNGARLVVAPPHTPSLDEIGSLIARHRVTTLWLTAGLFHVMVDRRLRSLAPLAQLLVGGDVLSVAHVRRVRTALPHIRLINGYGPTETTTFALCHTVRDVPADLATVPIGRPISRTEVFVLAPDLSPVPDGSPGELFIGGDGVARGYAGRPDLTAERFLRSPFDPSGASRFYRTGDRVRRLPDGNLEFIGRLDEQVKIRGYRIELQEVARALSRNPMVENIVVIAREGPNGTSEKRLVAYVVPRAGQPVSAQDLRSFAKTLLPEFMVPSTFVLLAALPLNENGKVDRKALPDPPAEPRPADAGPGSGTTALVARIWREVLGREDVDLSANFFDQGGDSLKLVDAHARLEEALGLPVPIVTLFAHPSIAALAEQLDRQAPRAEQRSGADSRARRRAESMAHAKAARRRAS